MAILETLNLKKTYQLGKVPVHALRGVNLMVEKGDFIAISGPSGSGKSTLLNMLGALDKPTEGKVFIEGNDISQFNENELSDLRRRIGFVFQFFNLIPRLSARENVELPMIITGKDNRIECANKLLALVGLEDRMRHKSNELSGGERQRVAIARALANNPSFLLMDEPTGNIDSKTSLEIMRLVKALNEEHEMSIIMVTHNLMVAAQAQRTVSMLDGKIIQDQVN
jgi:putative ABC transport system ATP-binding protein